MALTRRFTRRYARYSPGQLFALASDIESYPSFVPGCRRANIVSREGDALGQALTVENVFGFGPLNQPFRTSALLKPPHELVIVSRDGPWRLFSMHWRFQREQAGCRLSCEVTLDFASRVLNLLASLAAADVERQVLAAFERRAEKLFGVAAGGR
jgi:coenzyme Q-binding protein COQ10